MARIQLRRNTCNEWHARNPILRSGEMGYELDKGCLKIGDGLTRWNDLDYFIPESGVQALIAEALLSSGDGGGSLSIHINSDTPHPVYDDGPSLLLIYENAKV